MSNRKRTVPISIATLTVGIVSFLAVFPATFGANGFGAGLALASSLQAEQAPAPPPATQTAAGAGITPQPAVFKTDTAEFQLQPSEFLEYKYRMEKGTSMVYTWKATNKVEFDMHSEPDAGPKGYAETFEKGESEQGHGTYTAPFPGIHGWYWKNLGSTPATIRITSAGFYASGIEFRRGGFRKDYPLQDVKTTASN